MEVQEHCLRALLRGHRLARRLSCPRSSRPDAGGGCAQELDPCARFRAAHVCALSVSQERGAVRIQIHERREGFPNKRAGWAEDRGQDARHGTLESTDGLRPQALELGPRIP